MEELAQFARRKGSRDRIARRRRFLRDAAIAGGAATVVGGAIAGGIYLKSKLRRIPAYQPPAPALVHIPGRGKTHLEMGTPPGRPTKEWAAYKRRHPGAYRRRNRRKYDPGLFMMGDLQTAEFRKRGARDKHPRRKRTSYEPTRMAGSKWSATAGSVGQTGVLDGTLAGLTHAVVSGRTFGQSLRPALIGAAAGGTLGVGLGTVSWLASPRSPIIKSIRKSRQRNASKLARNRLKAKGMRG